MNKPIAVLKNITHEGPGIFAEVARSRNVELDIIDLSRGEDIGPLSDYAGVIVCGGPDSANDDTEKMKKEIVFVEEVVEQRIPYFGICLGMQVLAKAAGGTSIPSPLKEVGFRDQDGKQFIIDLDAYAHTDPVFGNLGDSITVFQLHGETIEPARTTSTIGTGKWVHHQVIKVGTVAYGIQSHMELTDEMFHHWLKLDPDLAAIESETITAQWNEIYTDYRRVGETLCNNFYDFVYPRL